MAFHLHGFQPIGYIDAATGRPFSVAGGYAFQPSSSYHSQQHMYPGSYIGKDGRLVILVPKNQSMTVADINARIDRLAPELKSAIQKATSTKGYMPCRTDTFCDVFSALCFLSI